MWVLQVIDRKTTSSSRIKEILKCPTSAESLLLFPNGYFLLATVAGIGNKTNKGICCVSLTGSFEGRQ